MKSWRASLSAIFARKGPPEKVDKAVKLGFPCRFCRAKRKADSINSDMVRPCRAASCLTLAIKRSSILRVVFIRKTLHENMAIWSKSQSDVGAKRLGMKRFAELLRDAQNHPVPVPGLEDPEAVADVPLPLTTLGRFELLNAIRLSVFRDQLDRRTAAIDVQNNQRGHPVRDPPADWLRLAGHPL